MAELLATVLLSIQIGLIISIALYIFWMAKWLVLGKLDAPFLPTPVRYAPLVLETLAVQAGDIVYELGSGDGRFMLECAKLAPKARFVGIERNPFLHGIALLRKKSARNAPNVEFRRGNFFDADFSEATKVYAYLLDDVMFRLSPKFQSEFKGRIASRAFPIPRKELSNVVALTERIGAHGQHLLFVYDF